MSRIMCIAALFVFLVTIANAELVSSWNFDEGQGNVAIDSAGGHDGTLINGPSWTSGKIGGALNFDDTDDQVYVADTDSLDFGANDSFTLMAWVKSDSKNATIFSKRGYNSDGYTSGYCLNVHFATGQLWFAIEGNSDDQSYIKGETNLVDGLWHHVAAVRDTVTDKLLLYVDGKIDATSVIDTTTTSLANNKPLRIGTMEDLYYQAFFDGSIDDMRIYNHALTEQEIVNIVPEPTTILLLTMGAFFVSKKRKLN